MSPEAVPSIPMAAFPEKPASLSLNVTSLEMSTLLPIHELRGHQTPWAECDRSLVW